MSSKVILDAELLMIRGFDSETAQTIAVAVNAYEPLMRTVTELRRRIEILTLDLQVFFDAVDGDPKAVQFFDLTFFKKVKADVADARGTSK